MSSLSFLGSQMLALCLPAALYSFLFHLVGAARNDSKLSLSAQRATLVVFALLTFCVFGLVCAFFLPDYSIRYVAAYSSRSLPFFYKLTGLWAGLDGSILFWTWLVSLYSVLVLFGVRKRHPDWIPWINATFMGILLFFIGLMLFANNPFTPVTGPIPTDGKGLNPLLQNIAMVMHPPALYLGYTGFSVPFAFVIAALVTRRLDATWIEETRTWTMIAWSFLTIGLILGGAWAYVELGWGGFWAWDPVENAALMPWLTATAYIHSVMIQKRRGMLLNWNVGLIILTFVLTIFGTYLTRSGVVQSVHAFSEGEIGPYFLSFLGLIIVVGYGLMISRRKELRSSNFLESWLSKEAAFLMNNVLFVTACLIVIWGTLFPTLTEFVTKDRIAVGPSFFNESMAPIAVVLLLLMGIGPLISWKNANPKRLLRQLVPPISVGAVTALLVVSQGYREWFTWLSGGLIGFVAAAIGIEFYRGMRVHRLQKKCDWFTALLDTLFQANRRFGGYIVHLGMLILFIGIIGSGYKSEADFVLNEGQSYSFKNYRFDYIKPKVDQDEHKIMVSTQVKIYKDDRFLGEIEPAKNFYFASQQPSTEVGIWHEPWLDVYLVLGNLDEKTSRADFRIMLNPLISCVWLGGVIMVLGILLVILPRTRRNLALWFIVIGLGLHGYPQQAAASENAAPVVHEHAHTEGHAHHESDSLEDPFSSLNIDDARLSRLKKLSEKYFCLCGDCVRLDLKVCTCDYAQKERREILGLMDQGKSDESIDAVLLAKYGPQVYAIPPTKGFFEWSYRGVWILSFLAFVIGMSVVAYLVRLRRGTKKIEADLGDDKNLNKYEEKFLKDLDKDL